MSERTDHPPSTNGQTAAPEPGRTAQRAILGGVLGLALLIGPVVLATVVLPDGGDDRVEAAGSDPETSLINARKLSLQMEHDKARALGLKSIATTTTTAPPTTTTTAPPTTTTTEPPPPPTTEEPPAEEPPPTETPPPPDSGGGLGDPNSYATWDALAECESGGDWHINTGNGYYGGLQFSLGSWQAVGGTGYPHENSRETQITMGQRLYASSGWGAWPACTAQLGWR
jgi:Transglycosylase-like domain